MKISNSKKDVLPRYVEILQIYNPEGSRALWHKVLLGVLCLPSTFTGAAEESGAQLGNGVHWMDAGYHIMMMADRENDPIAYRHFFDEGKNAGR